MNKSAVKSRVTQQLEIFALRSLGLADQPARYAPGQNVRPSQFRRCELTWRVIGFAEVLGIQIGELQAATVT